MYKNPRERLLFLVMATASTLLGACGASAPGDQGGTGGAAQPGASGGGMGTAATGGHSATGEPPGTGGAPNSGGDHGAGGSQGSSGGSSGGMTANTGGNMVSGGSGSGGTQPGGGGNRDAGADTGPAVGMGGATTADAGADSIAAGDGGPPPTGKITVWLAGDSTMQPCSGACPCGWGSQFQPYFASNATVVNSAAGGRSIQTWLYDPNVTTMADATGECVVSPKTYSSRWQAMLNGMKAGDYLLIEFGINDGDANCTKSRHVGSALFQTYLGDMAQAAKMRGAQAIFLTSTSMMQCTGATVTPNRGFGPDTKAAATANNVPIIDLTQLSAALYTSLGLCPNALDFTSTTSAVGKFFCDDHTHFEAAGATQVAGAVAKALRDQNIGLAAYLK